MLTLRPYQVEPLQAIVDSVRRRKGLTFTVMMSRQAGKNELSAQLEVLLLTLFMARGGDLVKCSPTFIPQGVNSIDRLKARLDDHGYAGLWTSERGYAVRLGRARAIFFSAAETANVVGQTAHLLLEVDEAQDVSAEKFNKDFRPMGASTNVTTVLYGTAWDEQTLLEETRRRNLELEARDGIRRHFEYAWPEVATCNPDYARYVEAERARLGADHPLFTTQYELRPLRSGGGFLSAVQRASLHGDHPRRATPEPPRVYVGGLDLAGEAEEHEDAMLRAAKPRQDSTVLTIAELDFGVATTVNPLPAVRVVDHYWRTGVHHHALLEELIALARTWGLRRLAVDATGVGLTIASLLERALGTAVVERVVFTAQEKSKLAFGLLAAVNAGRLRLYQADGSAEHEEFFHQAQLARAEARPNQTLTFFVPPERGHDDFLVSAALAVRAAESYRPRRARGRMVE